MRLHLIHLDHGLPASGTHTDSPNLAMAGAFPSKTGKGLLILEHGRHSR